MNSMDSRRWIFQDEDASEIDDDEDDGHPPTNGSMSEEEDDSADLAIDVEALDFPAANRNELNFKLQVRRFTRAKMELADKMVGLILSFIRVLIFTYYTFSGNHPASDHFIHKYFLQPYLYMYMLVLVLLCFLSVFIEFVMIKSKKKTA